MVEIDFRITDSRSGYTIIASRLKVGLLGFISGNLEYIVFIKE